MNMQQMDDLQRLTASQGVLLYRLVDLGYLTRAQVDELITRLVRERLIKAQEYLAFAKHAIRWTMRPIRRPIYRNRRWPW